jgi:hypothetical protein
VIFSSQMRSMQTLIGMIILPRIPAEIGEPVVFFQAVVVTSLHPNRAWADERCQHNLMDKASGSSWPAQINVTIALPSERSGQYAIVSLTPNST